MSVYSKFNILKSGSHKNNSTYRDSYKLNIK